MLTIIIKRSAEPNVIQLTQENVMKELGDINNSEMLLEDSWTSGLKRVRTPFVCLIEADCVLSGGYIASNAGLMKKTATKGYSGDGLKGGSHGGGGYHALAMTASAVGCKSFANRIYSYEMQEIVLNKITLWQVRPARTKKSSSPYHVQVGFVPGAVMRYSAIKDLIDDIQWDAKDIVRMSTDVSFALWETNRRIQVNPNTTYVSNEDYLENPPAYDVKVPYIASNIFEKERI